MLYFNHYYFHVQYMWYSKNYIRLLAFKNFLFFIFKKISNISKNSILNYLFSLFNLERFKQSIIFFKKCFKTSGNFNQYWDLMNYENHDKIYLWNFYFFYWFFYKTFCTCIKKSSTDSSAKYYQSNKETLQKSSWKISKTF